MDLEELFNKYGSDKGSKKASWSPNIHYYHRMYSILFEPIREEVKCLLEIGVWRGASLKAYMGFFPNASLWGIDILKYKQKKYKRINLITGDAFKDDIIKLIPENIDIIIEDSDHTLSSQLKALKGYWPKLKKGGLFIIEDIMMSPWPGCPDSSVLIDNNKPYLPQRPFDHPLLNHKELPNEIKKIFDNNHWFWAITNVEPNGGLHVCIVIKKN